MDRKRRLMENNNGWPLRNQLFDGAPIALPLTHTVIGRGGLTPSFTRATTETGQKWDEAGYLDFTALAGEMVFKGARRERNLLATSSKDFSVTTGISLNATPTAGSVVFTNASAYRYKRSLAIPGTKVQCSCLVKSSDGSKAVVGVRGYGVASGASAVESVALTTEYQQITITISGATTNEAIDFGLENRIGIGGDGTAIGTVEITQIQINDITGETDQTTIRPYVSVGVESAPAYHGSMVDGVKCYDTDRSGNPISTSGSYPLVGYVPWEARTNLCLQSEDLSTTWGNNNTTESVNAAVVSPNGTTTADKLVEAATNTTHTIHNTVAGTSGVYTTSVYLKAAGRTWAYITEGNSVTSTAYFDLTNGVVGTVGGTGSPSARIVDAGNGWYRCSMTFTAGANANIQIGTSTGDTISSFLGDITKGVYVWGAQLELGSFATPYIPTTTVAVARNADVLTYTGADVANIKTLAATFSRGVGVATAGTVAALSDNTANEYSSINLTSATAVRFDGVDGGVSKWQTTASNAYTPAATSKAAYSAATNSIKMDLDGTAQTEDTVATLPTVTQVQVGHLNGATVLNGPVGQIFAWTRNLSQSELGAVDRA